MIGLFEFLVGTIELAFVGGQLVSSSSWIIKLPCLVSTIARGGIDLVMGGCGGAGHELICLVASS